MEGWMTKKGGRISTWRRRWFVLGGEKLEYFTDQEKKAIKGHVLLKDVTEVGHILHETRNNCIGIRTEKRLYVVSCEDETQFDQWMEKMRAIQPRELDSEYTNVPHSSLGNLEKMLFKKSKKPKDVTNTTTGQEGGTGTQSSGGTPPSSTGGRDSQQTGGNVEDDKSSSGGASSNPGSSDAPRKSSSPSPSSNRNTETPREGSGAAPAASETSAPIQDDSTPSTTHSNPNDQVQSAPSDSNNSNNGQMASATASAATQGPVSQIAPSPGPQSSSPSSARGFGALHTSFDLDFGMTLNPALTASPLEESPFADAESTTTISVPTPIVPTSSEDSPFE